MIVHHQSLTPKGMINLPSSERVGNEHHENVLKESRPNTK